jgi:hypothetical protein
MLWHSLLDWEMWPVFLIGLSFLIPNYPATAYLTLNLKSLGFSTFHTNLLTIPAYVLFIINLLFWTWVSEKTNQRFITGLISQIWCLPLLVALEVLPAGTSPWVKWAVSVLIVGGPYVHAINVAITSRNAGSVRTRTVASALYNMFVQASSVIGSNVSRQCQARGFLSADTATARSTATRISRFTGLETKSCSGFVDITSCSLLGPSSSTFGGTGM